jgi:hypothetical protein
MSRPAGDLAGRAASTVLNRKPMKTAGSSAGGKAGGALDGVQGAAPDRSLQPDRHQVGCHRQRQRAQGHGRQRIGGLAGTAGEAVDQKRRDRRRHQHSRKTPAARVGRVDGERGEHRHAGAAGRVEEEVVGGGHDREHDQRRVEGPQDAQHPRADEHDGGGADDQGVGGVQARHRRVRVGQRGDQAGVVIDGRLVERIHEAERAQHPRRCRRVERVAGQADRVGGDEHVSHQRERVVAAQVDPEQEPEADRELAVEVRPVGDAEATKCGDVAAKCWTSSSWKMPSERSAETMSRAWRSATERSPTASVRVIS